MNSDEKVPHFILVSSSCSIPTNMKKKLPPRENVDWEKEESDGYESPTEGVDMEGDNFTNRKLLSNLYDKYRGRFSGDRKIRKCHNCGVQRDLSSKQVVYHCFKCDNDSDLCGDCFKKGLHHFHNENNFFHVLNEIESSSLEKVNNCKCCCESMIKSFEIFGDRFFIGERKSVSEKFSWLKYGECYEYVKNFSNGLNLIGLCKDDFVGIVSKISIQYIIADFSCLYSGLASVAVHRTMNLSEKIYITKLTNIKCIVCSKDYLEEVREIKKKVECVKYIVVVGITKKEEGNGVYSYDTIVEMGKNKEKKMKPVYSKEKDIFTVCFSSGSTGFPKGIVYKDSDWNRKILIPVFPVVELLIDELSYISGRLFVKAALANGGRFTILTNNDKNNLFSDLRDCEPTYQSLAPRVINFVYDEFKKEVKVRLQKRKDVKKVKTEVLFEFRKKNFFGKKICFIDSGGGPVIKKVKRFIRKMALVPVHEGYGASEVLGVITYNHEIVSKNSVKIVSVPELGYTVDDRPFPRGEVVIRDNGCVLKYLTDKNNKNSRVDSDGWYHTKDVAERRGDNLFIIDRCSNIIKLSQGVFISLAKIEEVLNKSELIERIICFPNCLRTKLLGVVIAKDSNIDKSVIFNDVLKVAKENSLKNYEIPSNIVIVKEKFTIDNKFLTISNKINRKKVIETYKKRIEDTKEMEKWISRILNIDKVGKFEDKKIFQFGVDSLSTVKLMNEVKKNFNQDITFNDIMSNDISDVVSKIVKGKRRGEEEIRYIDIEKEERKMKDSLKNIKFKEKKEVKCIFITGATSFLGKYLIQSVIELFGNVETIYCLIRENSIQKMKLKDKRLVAIIGDLKLPLFGIGEEKFREISKRVDLIFHLGCRVNHFLDYHLLYRVNVEPLYTLVKLANGVHIHYVSSISVFNSIENVNIFNQKHDTSNGYCGTKWVVDYLLCKYYTNSTVHRLNLLGFCTSTFSYNKRDWFNCLVKGILDFEMVPNVSDDVVPVDMYSVNFVALCIAKIALRKHKESLTGFREFDYSNQNLNFKQIIEYIRLWMKDRNISIDVKIHFPSFIQKMKENCVSRNHCLTPFLTSFEGNGRLGDKKFKFFKEKNLREFFEDWEDLKEIVKYEEFSKFLGVISSDKVYGAIL